MRIVKCDANGWSTKFSLDGEIVGDFEVALAGEHYAQNSTAVLLLAHQLGLDVKKAAEGLKNFEGVGRRFTRVGIFNGVVVVDDYAHHPTEIKATIKAAKNVGDGKVIAVVQPHRYSRLKDLMEEFAVCADEADVTLLLPVHSAGEAPVEGVNSDVLASKMLNVIQVQNEDDLRKELSKIVQSDDVILCMGAGSISGMAKNLCEEK